jgi:integrase
MRSLQVPSYRLHRGSGQAFVQHRGKRFYLGVHGTEDSREKYRQFVAELMKSPTITPSIVEAPERVDITVVELAASYREWATGYYRKNGEPTGHLQRVWAATAALAELYGRIPAKDFGPLKYQALQASLIAKGLSRNYINSLMGDIRRAFRWASANELLPVTVYQSLGTVSGLKQGRSEARETAPVLPVDRSVVAATLACLSPIVADMVRLQMLTGMRPGEVCQVRPSDIDTTVDPWQYRPERHKTQHHGRERVVHIGPQAQELLHGYLHRPAEGHCFSPAEAVAMQLAARSAKRRTPISCGNRPGTNRKRQTKRSAGTSYDVHSYRRAIARGVKIANRERRKLDPAAVPLPNWHPNQLRHTAATEIRRQFGLEAAQVALGHSSADITQIYAERNYGLAAEVAKKIG